MKCIILISVAMITVITQPLINCLSADIIVNTSKGKIRGYIGGPTQSRINIFKGIPFARPPIGSNRFKKPLSVQQWDGIYDGTYYRSACMSNTAYTSSPQKNISEDCLYLNIFADPQCAEGECAVVVYIHGGSFYFQSAVIFNEDSIAEKYASHRIIFVIPAYRLGIFGFISIGDGTSAPKNLGIHDLIAALRWVHTEISTFGGNPNRVTLMGHSCGATTVQILTLSPNIPDNFFQQGISMSSADLYRKNLSNPMTMEIAYRVRCARRGLPYKSEAVVECLRWKPADELLYHQRALTDVEYFDLMFGPEPDEELFPAEAPVLLPRQNRRRIFIGITKNELIFTRVLSTTQQECKTFTGVFGYHTKEVYQACLDNYSFRNGKLLVMRDETRASTFRMATKLAANNAKIFLYSFEMPKHDSHSGDLIFAIGTHPQQQMDDNEIAMNQIYPEYMRNFIHTGQPTAEWLPFDFIRSNFMRITYETISNDAIIKPHMKFGFYPNEVKLWLDYFARIEQRTLHLNKNRAQLRIGEYRNAEINNNTGIGLGTLVFKWMSAFWILFAFFCLLLVTIILVMIQFVINNGLLSFLRRKLHKRSIPNERTRILTALNGMKYTLDEDGEELKIF